MYILDPKFAMLIYEINNLKIKVAEKIVERDSLIYHTCKNLKIDYMLKIGSLEYKLLKIQNEILIAKRKIEILKDKHKNKENIDIDVEEINKKIEIEFLEFNKIEKNMLEDIDIAIDLSMSDILDNEQIHKINEIYLKLQSRCNPIFNTEYDDNNFKKIEKLYKLGNIKKLESMLKDEQGNPVIDEIENLEKFKKRYEEIIRENNAIITKIKNNFPYNQKNLLENESLCRRKKNDINDLIYMNEQELDLLIKECNKLTK